MLPEILRHSVPLSARTSSSLDSKSPNADRSQGASMVVRRPAQAVANIGLLGAAATVPQTKLGPGK